jgi:hypothetical protein
MAVLLCATAMALVGCEDNSRLEGTYIVEGGTGERIFVFSEDLLVMYQFIDTEMVEFHYTYEIESYEDGAERLILTYKGLVYGGSDPDVSWYLTGQREQYARDPVVASSLVRADGYLLINGQKYIKQET